MNTENYYFSFQIVECTKVSYVRICLFLKPSYTLVRKKKLYNKTQHFSRIQFFKMSYDYVRKLRMYG